MKRHGWVCRFPKIQNLPLTAMSGINIIRRVFRQIGLHMNRPTKKDTPLNRLMLRRSWCVLVALCLCIPIAFAEDFGLVNPAEKEFGAYEPDMRNTDNFAKTSPAFRDRTVPSPPKKEPEMIRQVSTSAEDPFPVVSPPMVAQAPAAMPNYPMMAQNNVVPYDFNAAAQYNVPNVYGLDYYPQFAQLPQQQYQGYQGYEMMGGNPYQMYPQFAAVADPYAMGYQADYLEPDYSMTYYQLLAMQELMNRQTEAQEKSNGEKEAEEAKKQADANWTLNNLMPVRVTSPLGETLLVCAKTMSPFSSPNGPDRGVGMPLVSKSWLDHPYYFGGFVGGISGSQLVSKMINQKNGGHGGLIFGYNFNDYWGLESRLHFSAIDIRDTEYARDIVEGMINPGTGVVPLWTTRTNELTVLDAAVHYYPLGNAKWRPYCRYGLGFGRQKFVNSFGYTSQSDIVTMPLGIGLRYWWNERLAIQADLTDNIIFASGIAKTQNNIACTIGLTYAFGTGRRVSPVHYWPATPSMGSKW